MKKIYYFLAFLMLCYNGTQDCNATLYVFEVKGEKLSNKIDIHKDTTYDQLLEHIKKSFPNSPSLIKITVKGPDVDPSSGVVVDLDNWSDIRDRLEKGKNQEEDKFILTFLL